MKTTGRFALKILAIDTSGVQAGAAVVTGNNSPYITAGEITLNARTGERSWTHSEILMPAVEQLFKLTRLEPSDMDYVAYTNGPGSFTGLRIGAAAALGIARALNKPAIAVPTLDTLAYNILCSDCIIVPMLDARRGQVYTAVYSADKNGRIKRETEFLALPLEDFLNEYLTDKNKPVFFLGDGADEKIISEKIPDAVFAPANNNRQRAASAAVWALEKISEGHKFSNEIEIKYVRAPQAVRCAQK
jgi:tRNA threonylcarbamoyladenosine biosynthesis protein TsaB